MTGSIAVDVSEATPSHDTGFERPSDESLGRWVRIALEDGAVLPGCDIEVAILLADKATVRRMNRDYRGKDRPTNVLSFAAGDVAGLPPDAPKPLGDIVLCAEVIVAEAAEQGKEIANHWAHLCVHGALHLAGFDHESDADAELMEALEITILGKMGITDPYSAIREAPG